MDGPFAAVDATGELLEDGAMLIVPCGPVEVTRVDGKLVLTLALGVSAGNDPDEGGRTGFSATVGELSVTGAFATGDGLSDEIIGAEVVVVVLLGVVSSVGGAGFSPLDDVTGDGVWGA